MAPAQVPGVAAGVERMNSVQVPAPSPFTAVKPTVDHVQVQQPSPQEPVPELQRSPQEPSPQEPVPEPQEPIASKGKHQALGSPSPVVATPAQPNAHQPPPMTVSPASIAHPFLDQAAAAYALNGQSSQITITTLEQLQAQLR